MKTLKIKVPGPKIRPHKHTKTLKMLVIFFKAMSKISLSF